VPALAGTTVGLDDAALLVVELALVWPPETVDPPPSPLPPTVTVVLDVAAAVVVVPWTTVEVVLAVVTAVVVVPWATVEVTFDGGAAEEEGETEGPPPAPAATRPAVCVGDEIILGSTQSPLCRPISPGRQQK